MTSDSPAPPPKFVQITATLEALFALDESGRVWSYYRGIGFNESYWYSLNDTRKERA